MLTISINNKEYNLYTEWRDLTLSKMSELSSLVSSFPDWLVKLHTDESFELSKEQEREFTKFIRESMILLSEVPASVIERTDQMHLVYLYAHYIKRFVLGYLIQPDYEIQGITHFEYNGITYKFPKSEVDLSGNTMPCVDVSALELSEASDLKNASDQLQGGNILFSANVISILCRKEGEQYDEEICKQRAKEFTNLTMDIVIEVFFCFRQLTIISKQNTQIFTLLENLIGR